MGWAPGPGGPSAAAVGMDGPGSPLPSRDSSHCLRGGGGSLAGLSRVCGWKKRRPSAWERLRCLTCFQSFSYGGSFPLVTYMTCGWEGGVGGGLKSKPPPRPCLQEPRPRGSRLPWRRTRGGGPACSGLVTRSVPCPPPRAQRTVGRGSTEARPGPRRRRGPFGDGGHGSHSAPGL